MARAYCLNTTRVQDILTTGNHGEEPLGQGGLHALVEFIEGWHTGPWPFNDVSHICVVYPILGIFFVFNAIFFPVVIIF